MSTDEKMERRTRINRPSAYKKRRRRRRKRRRRRRRRRRRITYCRFCKSRGFSTLAHTNTI